MPTPEANASSSSLVAAPINANITELAVEEADSFKANVSTTMTQDQCLDNGHQANSNNNRSSSGKVSDDLNNSKNSVVSNGVNSVQEFNVDVNREYSTDLVIVQNSTVVDADCSPTGKVLSTSEQLLLTENTPSDFVDSKDNSDNSINNNIDAIESECANNIVADMTVITHQNSSENIRDIIANSDKANKNSNSDSQLDAVEKNAKSDTINHMNSRNPANKSPGTRRSRKLVRSENVNECEDVQIEDPVERLNKLRASISSALSEVKGVLKQYSTEQSCDDQNESAPSKQPADDGPVRFRFVRKIRRRSVFSEEDETEIPKTTTDIITTSPIIENKVIEEVPNEFQDIQKVLSNENQNLIVEHKDEITPNSAEIEKPIKKDNDETDKKLIQTATTEITSDAQVIQDKSDNSNTTTASENEKTTKEDSSTTTEVVAPSTSETPKSKNGKTKKILKKDRRASIAAVEINQISNDQSPIPVELKTQRRPSDSGTLVKQTTTRIKAKTSEKPKLILNRKVKVSNSSAKTASSTSKPSQTEKAVEKIDDTLSPTEEKPSLPIVDSSKTLQSSDVIVIENQTQSTEPKVSIASSSGTPLESTQKTITSPVVVESKAVEKPSAPAKDNLSPVTPTVAEVTSHAKTSDAKLNTSAVTPLIAEVTSPAETSDPKLKTSVVEPTIAEVTSPTEASDPKLNTPDVKPSPAASSTVKADVPKTSPTSVINSTLNTDVPQNSSKVTEINASAELSLQTSSTVKADVAKISPTSAINSTVNTDVPQTSSKVTETNKVKLNIPEVASVPSAVSTKVKNNSIPEMGVTPVDPFISEAPNNSKQQIPKTTTEATKVGTLNQQTAKSKQLSQVSKTEIPTKKSNTPASQTKTPLATPAPAKVEPSKRIIKQIAVEEPAIITPVQSNQQTKQITEAEKTKVTKAAPVKDTKTMHSTGKIEDNKKSHESVVTNDAKVLPSQSTSGTPTPTVAAETSTKIVEKTSQHETKTSSPEADVPIPTNVPKDAIAVKLNLPGQESVEELQRLEDQQEKETSPPQTPETAETAATAAPAKKKRKAKRKVVIRRIKRKLSKDDTFLQTQEAAAELEITEKDIEEPEPEPEEEVLDVPKQPKSCLKNRQFEIGDVVMYAEHYKKTQVRWKKAIVTERITSISYKLNIEGGDERPAHISYIKKFTDRKVNFGGKEYLEIDYAQIEENEEKERNYSIWNLV